jgi:hypothetical protein
MMLGVLLLRILERSSSGSLIADFMCAPTRIENVGLVAVVLYCIFGINIAYRNFCLFLDVLKVIF